MFTSRDSAQYLSLGWRNGPPAPVRCRCSLGRSKNPRQKAGHSQSSELGLSLANHARNCLQVNTVTKLVLWWIMATLDFPPGYAWTRIPTGGADDFQLRSLFCPDVCWPVDPIRGCFEFKSASFSQKATRRSLDLPCTISRVENEPDPKAFLAEQV